MTKPPKGSASIKCFFIFMFLLAFTQMTLDLHIRNRMKLRSKFVSYKMRPFWQNEYLLFLIWCFLYVGCYCIYIQNASHKLERVHSKHELIFNLEGILPWNFLMSSLFLFCAKSFHFVRASWYVHIDDYTLYLISVKADDLKLAKIFFSWKRDWIL